MKLAKSIIPILLIIGAFVLGFVAWYNDASFVAYVGCLFLLLGGMDWGKR